MGEWDDAPLETLYLGGGTPSLLPAEQLAELLDLFLPREPTGKPPKEVTLEANPDDVTEPNSGAWAAAGVNRVSLGVQSFNARALEWLHRTHTPEQAVTAVRFLRDAGMTSISLDLLAALPPELEYDLQDDLEQALELGPDHVSVYGLTSEPRTTLARWVARNAVSPASEEVYARDFMLAHDLLTEAGYEHYEVSNFAKQGSRSRHNCAYWDGSSYVGLGPSSHGFDGRERRWNVGPWAEYERRILASGDATQRREKLDSSQGRLERTYLGLRTLEGLPEGEIHGFDANLIARAEENGWAESVAGRWRLTATGWLRLDALVTALTTSPEGG